MATDNPDEEGLVKYGVVLDDQVKTADDLSMNATDLTRCPWCSQKLDILNPPHCPEHGTEPWEKRGR